MTGWGRPWKSDAALCHSSGPTCSCTWSHQQYVSLMLKRQSGEQQAGGVLRAWILNSESQQRKPGLFTDTASCSSVAHIKTQVIFWPGSDWAVRPLEALHRCRPLTKITIRRLPAQLHGNPTKMWKMQFESNTVQPPLPQSCSHTWAQSDLQASTDSLTLSVTLKPARRHEPDQREVTAPGHFSH